MGIPQESPGVCLCKSHKVKSTRVEKKIWGSTSFMTGIIQLTAKVWFSITSSLLQLQQISQSSSFGALKMYLCFFSWICIADELLIIKEAWSTRHSAIWTFFRPFSGLWQFKIALSISKWLQSLECSHPLLSSLKPHLLACSLKFVIAAAKAFDPEKHIFELSSVFF